MSVAAGGSGGGPPLVAIVGRPNVGKSSLANRVVGHRAAIVQESPGVTRDRKVLEADWNGVPFAVVDTGGWSSARDDLAGKVSDQAERAVGEADLVLLVVDAAVGVTVEDEEVAKLLKRSRIPVLVVANKVDSPDREPDAWAAAKLGLGDPWMVSALHGTGTGDLLDEVVRRLRAAAGATVGRERPAPEEGAGWVGSSLEAPVEDSEAEQAAVSIVGRPNVGKSTLFNRLAGAERSVVHELPGTTRDAIDTVVETEAGRFRFIDTAGMRRRSRLGEGAEYYSLVRALQAIDRADVALLVIDATEGVTQQDQRLGERVDAAGSPVVIVMNKWECLDAEGRAQALTDVEDRMAFLSYAPVVKVSAKTGLGVHRILPSVSKAVDAYHLRVPTSKVNRVIGAAQARHPAPGVKVLYAVQGAVDPPTFTLFSTGRLPATYLRYLERTLREELDFGPTPLKVRVRRRSGR